MKLLLTEFNHALFLTDSGVQNDFTSIPLEDVEDILPDYESLTLLEPSYKKVQKTTSEIRDIVLDGGTLYKVLNEHGAVVMLLLPPNQKTFDEALKEEIVAIENKEQLEAEMTERRRFLFLKTRKGQLKLDMCTIDVLEGAGNYSYIFTNEMDRYITRGNLSQLSRILPPDGFVRVHKSFIVNIERIELVKTDSLIVGDRVVPIGKSYRNDLKKVIKKIQQGF